MHKRKKKEEQETGRYLPATNAKYCLVDGSKSCVIYPITKIPVIVLDKFVPNASPKAPELMLDASPSFHSIEHLAV